MIVHRHLRRALAPSVRSIGRPGALVLALAALLASSGAMAQVDEQQMRCMQLQQELAAAQGGGGPELGGLEQQIAEQDRIYQGTQAAMEDAGCYERMFIFGRALKRNPRCLKMNARVEDARRQLARLQGQRQSLSRGGGNRRRQAELQQALSRAGCSGGAPRRSGGLFDFFGGQSEPEYQTPIYRSINPNGRYRSVCVRLCDGFYYPVSYSTYGSQLQGDAEQCQSNCAAPAELYVYRNPGQEIEQAISLSGSAYMDLPVALKYRKEYVKGCSCKQTEYNPTQIEAANKKAEVAPAPGADQGNLAAAPAAQSEPAIDEMPELDLEITGSTEADQPAAQSVETEVTPPPPPPPPQAAEAPPAPPAPPPATAEGPGQSTIIKKPRAAAN